MTDTPTATPAFVAEMPEPFHPGWNKVAGLVAGGHAADDENKITIYPDEYFYRYENPSWIVCDWETIRAELLDAKETPRHTIEQQALNVVQRHGRSTDDPAEVLSIAWKANAYQFRDELLNSPGLIDLGVTGTHLRMLREVATIMALNRVEVSGRISNVGPAWMLPATCTVVYGLDEVETALIDEVYHDGWICESRRIEAVKLHAALGGKLVHGGQGGVDMRGGVVVPFGCDLVEFERELRHIGDDWITLVDCCG